MAKKGVQNAISAYAHASADVDDPRRGVSGRAWFHASSCGRVRRHRHDDADRAQRGGGDAGRAGVVRPDARPRRATTATQVQEVVVTGSILRRKNLETDAPLTIQSQVELQNRGITTVQDAIQDLSGNNSGALPNNFGGAFAHAASGASLRGLTTNSTLVLVNGLRTAYYPLSDDGVRNFVDLNTIPDFILDRVETCRTAPPPPTAPTPSPASSTSSPSRTSRASRQAEGGLAEQGGGGSDTLARRCSARATQHGRLQLLPRGRVPEGRGALQQPARLPLQHGQPEQRLGADSAATRSAAPTTSSTASSTTAPSGASGTWATRPVVRAVDATGTASRATTSCSIPRPGAATISRSRSLRPRLRPDGAERASPAPVTLCQQDHVRVRRDLAGRKRYSVLVPQRHSDGDEG